MTGPSSDGRTLLAATRVSDVLAREGVASALIGAVAAAAHGYPRSTADLDLAVGVAPPRMRVLASALEREGFAAELSEPDDIDPLGGVLRLTSAGIEPIEVVNFLNPPSGGFPALIEAALHDAEPYREGATLRVVRLPHLILFKLYAGGPSSRTDVLELLSRNPDVALDELRDLAARFRLGRRLEAWLRDLNDP